MAQLPAVKVPVCCCEPPARRLPCKHFRPSARTDAPCGLAGRPPPPRALGRRLLTGCRSAGPEQHTWPWLLWAVQPQSLPERGRWAAGSPILSLGCQELRPCLSLRGPGWHWCSCPSANLAVSCFRASVSSPGRPGPGGRKTHHRHSPRPWTDMPVTRRDPCGHGAKQWAGSPPWMGEGVAVRNGKGQRVGQGHAQSSTA